MTEPFDRSVMKCIALAASRRMLPGNVFANFEDLLQESRIEVWKAQKTFIPRAKFSTYAYDVALKRCTSIIVRELSRTNALPLMSLDSFEFDPEKSYSEVDLFMVSQVLKPPTAKGPDRKPRAKETKPRVNRQSGERFPCGKLKKAKV